MTDITKVLGQAMPTANTLTNLYTVGSTVKKVAVSSIMICNQNASQVKFRVSIAISGAGNDPKQYIYYDIPIEANDTFAATLGISLAATDQVRIYCDSNNVSFSMFGLEVI